MKRSTALETQHRLRDCGWPLQVDGKFGARSRAALKQFKRGNALSKLRNNSVLSPKTRKALAFSARNGGRCSKHFTYSQFKCHDSEGWIELTRELVHGLDVMCDHGMSVTIVDGYRSPSHNRSVGGEPNSEHLYGAAADIGETVSLARVKALHVFSGIGVQGSNGLVRHVDCRGMGSAPATTPGTPGSPTTWVY